MAGNPRKLFNNYGSSANIEGEEQDRNILIVGGTGAGKSSILNLLLENNLATVDDKAIGVSKEIQWARLNYEGRKFKLYDSTGLCEGTHGNNIDPKKQLKTWLEQRVEAEGISGFLMVIKKGPINQTVIDCYKFLHELRGGNSKAFPIIALISHFDSTNREENEKQLDHFCATFQARGMEFETVIASCAANIKNFELVSHESIIKRQEETRMKILEALSKLCNSNWKPCPDKPSVWRLHYVIIFIAVAYFFLFHFRV